MERRRALVAVVNSGFLIGLAVGNDSPMSLDDFDQEGTVVTYLVDGSELSLQEAMSRVGEEKISAVFVTGEGCVIGTSWKVPIRSWLEVMTDGIDFEKVEVHLEKLKTKV